MQWKNLTLAVALPLSALGWSCATHPVPVDLSTDHPAHPAAAETLFTPPPNPFADAEPLPAAAAEPTSMEHQGHGGHTGHGSHTMPNEELPPEPEKPEKHGHGHHPTEPPPGGAS